MWDRDPMDADRLQDVGQDLAQAAERALASPEIGTTNTLANTIAQILTTDFSAK
jgi:hypothetical protein